MYREIWTSLGKVSGLLSIKLPSIVLLCKVKFLISSPWNEDWKLMKQGWSDISTQFQAQKLGQKEATRKRQQAVERRAHFNWGQWDLGRGKVEPSFESLTRDGDQLAGHSFSTGKEQPVRWEIERHILHHRRKKWEYRNVKGDLHLLGQRGQVTQFCYLL